MLREPGVREADGGGATVSEPRRDDRGVQAHLAQRALDG